MYTNIYITNIVYDSPSVIHTSVLSVRIRRKLKEDALRLGVDVKAVVERALEEEIRRVRKAKLRELIEEVTKSTSMSVEDWVEAVKQSRLER